MIVSKKIPVKINPSNFKNYLKLNNSIKCGDIIEVDIENLSKGSRSIILVRCDICLLDKEIKYVDFTKYGYSGSEYLCKNCRSKKNNIEKYGVENVFQLDTVKDKSKKTKLDKYGVEHISQSPEIQEKIKNNNLVKYGAEHHLQNEEILNKQKSTNFQRYGVENISQLQEVKDKKYLKMSETSKEDKLKTILKRRNTNLEKYNLYNYFPNYRQDFIISKHKDYLEFLGEDNHLFKCIENHNYTITNDNFYNRVRSNLNLCTICDPINSLHTSGNEMELCNFIKSIYSGVVIPGYRDTKEIDIYLPDMKLGFEFNGLYWHSNSKKDDNYHLNKTNYFKEKDIRIIHIWEDDWKFKREIIESQIRNWLKIPNLRIFARKCQIKEIIDVKIVRKFLNDNHIQGYSHSIKKVGLYYNEELVSLMTFDKYEGRKKLSENEWNISRFCNKLNTSVIGGASKLMKYHLNIYNPVRIISYADKDWSIGELYVKLGFTKLYESNPDYKYIVDEQRVHKSRYKKSKLNTPLTESKFMEAMGILKIYDCGKIKFEMII